ncbi:hypothetical protein V6N12_029889 [Hibiscus sabdariffa]|uniref:DUF761 domain-containing protein n=1 Tax=Hibiscus sabdariffa TaxID=183260 RepID=A0ABR2D045_9ROSI
MKKSYVTHPYQSSRFAERNVDVSEEDGGVTEKKAAAAPLNKPERMPSVDINKSAEAFIQKFRHQLLLQRLESIENYQKMLARDRQTDSYIAIFFHAAFNLSHGRTVFPRRSHLLPPLPAQWNRSLLRSNSIFPLAFAGYKYGRGTPLAGQTIIQEQRDRSRITMKKSYVTHPYQSSRFAERNVDVSEEDRAVTEKKAAAAPLNKPERVPSVDINESAEAFIQKFRHQLLLQRLESIENYQQMMARCL